MCEQRFLIIIHIERATADKTHAQCNGKATEWREKHRLVMVIATDRRVQKEKKTTKSKVSRQRRPVCAVIPHDIPHSPARMTKVSHKVFEHNPCVFIVKRNRIACRTGQTIRYSHVKRSELGVSIGAGYKMLRRSCRAAQRRRCRRKCRRARMRLANFAGRWCLGSGEAQAPGSRPRDRRCGE